MEIFCSPSLEAHSSKNTVNDEIILVSIQQHDSLSYSDKCFHDDGESTAAMTKRIQKKDDSIVEMSTTALDDDEKKATKIISNDKEMRKAKRTLMHKIDLHLLPILS